ncbi:MAG: hypothetical protein NTV49_03900 [Kiritimatiellaeota bacterium]|nr:hypothetical protein [Kiritimatiellota bacterium]
MNNTYVNERQPAGSFLRVAGAAPKVRVVNNLITGASRVLAGTGQVTNNLVMAATGFVAAARYDYRLAPPSAAGGAGLDPGQAGDFNLTPVCHYQHPLGAESRPRGEKLNIGACPAKDAALMPD